jgi:hypothetical protein
MPGQIRSNKTAMKIVYNILKTPKEKWQKNQKNPPERLRKEWFRDSSTAQ